jgi:hypothetical protein
MEGVEVKRFTQWQGGDSTEQVVDHPVYVDPGKVVAVKGTPWGRTTIVMTGGATVHVVGNAEQVMQQLMGTQGVDWFGPIIATHPAGCIAVPLDGTANQ